MNDDDNEQNEERELESMLEEFELYSDEFGGDFGRFKRACQKELWKRQRERREQKNDERRMGN